MPATLDDPAPPPAFTLRRLTWCIVGAAGLFAAWIVIDTLRGVVSFWSPLPWFDEWATVDLIGRWRDGDLSAAEVLFAQHNEHRLVLPRLVFFADDLLFRGGGRLSLAAIFTVQALLAIYFARALARAAPRRPARWAVAAVVAALLFSLRQGENFSSGFQVQFVAVFAGATLAFAFLARGVGRGRSGRSSTPALAASLAAAALTALTMANGLAVAPILALLALAARLPWRVTLACALWALVLAVAYLHGYEPVEHHAHLSDVLTHPVDFLVYVAAYLGSFATGVDVAAAAALGALGIAASLVAAARAVAWRGGPPASLAMVGVMLFIGATAAITGAGRINFGTAQALSSRYATGSAVFWAAQLTYWWIDPPAWPRRLRGLRLPPAGGLARAGVAAVALALCWPMPDFQRRGRAALAMQSDLQARSADLLMLGLDDPAVVEKTAWGDDGVQADLPVLKANALSIFGTADYAAVGRPLAAAGVLADPDPCGGAVLSAVADAALGDGGVRVSGEARGDRGSRALRRVLLADSTGVVVGLASPVPGGPRGAWGGFARARPGASLTAYGRLPGGRLCRIGAATVAS